MATTDYEPPWEWSNKYREEQIRKNSIIPKLFIHNATIHNTKRNLIIAVPFFINIKQKELFLSLLYSYFKDSILLMRRYFWRGLLRWSKLMLEDFYDYTEQQSFYTKDLFDQLFTYSEKLLGEHLKWPNHTISNNTADLFWSGTQDIDSLVNAVKTRISHQVIDFNRKELTDLSEFIKNLESILLSSAQFLDAKDKAFFKRCIKSIKLIPAFQKFGFSQYYLYFRPFYYKSK